MNQSTETQNGDYERERVEVKGRIMEWVEIRRARRRDEQRQREAEIRAEGKAEVINALKALQKSSKEDLTLEQALQQYKSENGKKA